MRWRGRTTARIISVLPFNALRVGLYRAVFGYDIRAARLGWGTLIQVPKTVLRGCVIGQHNVFTGPMDVVVREGARIGNRNQFVCGAWTEEEVDTKPGYDRRLEIGERCVITHGHYFDVAGAIVVGAGSWIAGEGSQFWTHGAGDVAGIVIGERCYVGSAVRFGPGAGVASHTMVALGSVVVGRFEQEGCLVGGVPAKALKAPYDWESKLGTAARGASSAG